jgi:hypothetical protein
MALKIKLKSRRAPALPASPFNNIVSEAIDVSRKLNELRQFPACKLTAQSYLREMLNADPTASLKGVKKLRVEIAKKHANLAHSQRTLARMIAGLRGPNWTTPPTKYPGRLFSAFSTPESVAELIRYGSSTTELFGCAIEIVAESQPDLWGSCEDSAKHAAQVAELEARQVELFRKLESSVSGDDLHIDPVDRHAPVTFKVAPAVELAPRDNAGARLVAYLMQQRKQREQQSA